MSLDLRRRAELSPEQIAALEQALAAFYKNPPANYSPIADQAAQRYTPREQPFHCDLAGRVFPGARLLEVGCGTAHLCSHVEKNGGAYTGLDYSEALLQDNRRRLPQARFFPIGTALGEAFDIVASLYTLEHIADPPVYLESLWRYCRPGGLVAIICPEFIECPSFPPSVFFGKTPRRFREKLSALDLADAAGHLLDLKLRAPHLKKALQDGPPGAFWINLKPRILHGAEQFSSDADAVHLPRLKDLVWFFEQKNAAILQTSTGMPGVSDEILRYNCYVLARKPE
jgi:SAM-dependent methyltransferase